MERVVADALIGELAQGWRVDLAAEGGGLTEADVIHQYDQHIGRILAQMVLLRPPLVLGVLQSRRGDARRREWRKWKHRAIRRNGGLHALCNRDIERE